MPSGGDCGGLGASDDVPTPVGGGGRADGLDEGLALLLVVLDAAIVSVLRAAGVLGRLVLRRPWSVLATREDGHVLGRPVRGWRSALRERDRAAGRLSAAPRAAGR